MRGGLRLELLLTGDRKVEASTARVQDFSLPRLVQQFHTLSF